MDKVWQLVGLDFVFNKDGRWGLNCNCEMTGSCYILDLLFYRLTLSPYKCIFCLHPSATDLRSLGTQLPGTPQLFHLLHISALSHLPIYHLDLGGWLPILNVLVPQFVCTKFWLKRMRIQREKLKDASIRRWWRSWKREFKSY